MTSPRTTNSSRSELGWLAVTVLCEPSDIDTTALPAPLAELGARIEARVTPAPADKGTELAVRWRNRPATGSAVSRLTGSDPQADLRSALRQAKQLMEVGEVLVVDPVPHGHRKKTPGGLLLQAWTRVAGKAGVR